MGEAEDLLYLGLVLGAFGDEDSFWWCGFEGLVDGVASFYLDHGGFSGWDGFRGYYGCLIGVGGVCPPPPCFVGEVFGLVWGVVLVFEGVLGLLWGLVWY